MIGIKAFARCWVEPMRPVAPLTMMPIVWLAIVQFRCVAEVRGVVARLCYAACMRVHVPGEQGAAPHRLPELRLRHAIGFHRPRHDEPDGALARGVRPYRRAANPWFAQVSWHPRDLVRAGIYHRESSARVRGAAARRA